MRRFILISTMMVGGAYSSSNVMAMTCEVEYTTEWQTDFDAGYDWLNLLKLSPELQLSSSVSLQAVTLSVAKTGEQQLVEDLLTYSNIEAGNIPLTFARLGCALTVNDAELFVGINNVNEDYFTSDLTSFFSNSSCGITPTISCNFDIANYPVASWCLHYRQRLGDFSLQTSLYPGRGYSRILGHDNLFSLNIKRDGIFSISSIDYKHHDFNCILGVALHHGSCMGDEDADTGDTEPSASQKGLSVSPWLLSEISLNDRLGLLAQCSLSTVSRGCKAYAGMGLIYTAKYLQPGVYINAAKFTDMSEYCVELSCRILSLSDNIYLQPALHLVSNDLKSARYVGMLRLQMSL